MVWLPQAEAQFVLHCIVLKESHYFHVIVAVDSSTAIRMAPSLPALPSGNCYSDLKQMLLSTQYARPGTRS